MTANVMTRPDASDWITKDQAAAVLQCSKRSIERIIASGKIHTTKRERPRKTPETLCARKDVEALIQGAFLLPSPTMQTETATGNNALEATQIRPPAANTQNAAIAMLAAVAQKLATIATPATEGNEGMARPWLTVDEAAARSGLSRRLIRQLINEGEIIAMKDGRAWKVHSQSLTQWHPQPQARTQKAR